MDGPRSVANNVATQHRLIDSQLAKLAAALKAGALSDAEDRTQRLIRAIRAHFTLEEDHYFPRTEAAHVGFAGKVQALRAEHVELSHSLDEIARHIGDAALEPARTTFALFHTALLQHERAELALLEG